MATIKYLLQSKKDNAPIYLRFSLGRDKLLKRKTGLNIDQKKWSKSTGYPIAKDENTKRLKSDLQKLKIYIEDQFNLDNSRGNIIDGFWLEKQINTFFNRLDDSEDLNIVLNMVQHIIDNASTRRNSTGGLGLSKTRLNSYKNLKLILNKFLNGKTLLIKDVNIEFSEKLKDWMLNEQEYSENHILKKLSDLKIVCYEAEKLDIETHKQLRSIKVGSAKSENIIYLNREELRKIKDFEILSPKLNNAKKWLLLGCEIGQRVDDLLNITEKNIGYFKNRKFRVITLIQGKTKKEVIIPLRNVTEDIIKDGLPYKIAKSNFNKYIKEVCKKAGITQRVTGSKMCPKKKRKIKGEYEKWELITSHTCRRSFASNYYGEMETSIIKSLTGHSSEKTLLKYIGKTAVDYTEQAFLAMTNIKT